MTKCSWTVNPLAWPLVIIVAFAPYIVLDFIETRHAPIVVKPGGLGVFKLTASIVLIAVLLTDLSISLIHHHVPVGILISQLVSLVAAIAISWTSFRHHRRSVKPSTLVTVFLLASLFNDLLLLTLHSLAGSGPLPSNVDLVALEASTRFLFLVLECRPKSLDVDSYDYELSPMETSGVLSTTFFWWINPFLFGKKKGNLQNKDIPALDSQMRPKVLRDRILKSWSQRAQPDTNSALVRVLFRALRLPFLAVIVPRFALAVFRCSQPLLIGIVIDFIAKSQLSPAASCDRLWIILLSAVVYIGLNISLSVFVHRRNRLRIMINGSLISLIYHKTTTITSDSVEADRALTLMGNDVDDATVAAETFHEVWGYAVEVVLGAIVLAMQVDWLFLVPVAIIALNSRVTKFMAKNLRPRQKAFNGATQARMSALNSTLGHMKSLKALGWTETIVDYIQGLRTVEQSAAAYLYWMRAAHGITANALGLLSPTLTVVLYAVISNVNGTPLDVRKMLTAVAALTTVTHPANMVMTAVPNMIGYFASFERIQDFLINATEIKPTPSNTTVAEGTVPNSEVAIALKEVSVVKGLRTILKDISMQLTEGSITICCGKVGSGKSALAMAILGEYTPSTGFIKRWSTAIGFCNQTPWIPSGTIKDIICSYGKKGLYSFEEVIKASCLDDDISRLSSKERTLIGSRGINLSGGQKQRVALARLLYSGCKVAIFDDSFAALDGTTEGKVIENLFGSNGLLRKTGVATLWITNSGQYFDLADNVVVMEEGSIQMQGPWKSLKKSVAEVKKFTFADKANEEDHNDEVEVQQKPRKNADSEQDLQRRSGDLSLYAYYVRSGGLLPPAVVAVCAALYSFFGMLPNYWIKWWTEAPPAQANLYMIGYICLGVLAWASTSGTILSTNLLLGLRTGNKLHQRLANTVFLAPLSFFTFNDVGTILNRFGQDIGYVDKSLAAQFASLVNQIFKMIVQLSIVFKVQYRLVLVLPFCAVVVYSIAQLYLKVSRQLRILEIESKAGLYTDFTETLDGLVSIRAFNWQQAAETKMLNALEGYLKPNYFMRCLVRWLNLVLELIVASMAILLIALAVILGSVTAAEIGVALNIFILVNSTLVSLVSAWTTLEVSLGAVARLRSLEQDTPREDRSWETTTPPAAWPSRGELILRNLSAGYTMGNPVFKDMNVTVKAGQKLIICGRTGSGKTTVFLALLRLIECSGQIELDGVNITKIPRSTVRQRGFIAVPQDGVVLPKESLRFNLDPTNKLNEEIMIDTLREVALWDVFNGGGNVTSEMNTLDQPLEKLPVLSVGQSQLFALARAILRKHLIILSQEYSDNGTETPLRPVVLLDEATSSLDSETESTIYDVIEDEFVAQGYTVIIVSHRLGGLVNRLRPGQDAVAVLENGSMTVETNFNRIQKIDE